MSDVQSKSSRLVDDWMLIEGVLNATSYGENGASEPLYSCCEEAKAALFRIACLATTALEAEEARAELSKWEDTKLSDLPYYGSLRDPATSEQDYEAVSNAFWEPLRERVAKAEKYLADAIANFDAGEQNHSQKEQRRAASDARLFKAAVNLLDACKGEQVDDQTFRAALADLRIEAGLKTIRDAVPADSGDSRFFARLKHWKGASS